MTKTKTTTTSTKPRAKLAKSATRTAKTVKAPAKSVHPIVHHAKRVYHLTPKFVHGMVAGAFIGLLVVGVIRNSPAASALTISSPRDCDTNAVMNCGALTTAEVQKKYSNAGVSAIYNYYKISAQDIKDIDKMAVSGRVYKDGTVRVGNTIVGTGAVSAGRVYLKGSTAATSGGVKLYNSPPSTSFIPTSIAAFVVMKDGQFKYAILGACGNPVSAKPIPKAPTPPKTTPTPPVTPTPETPVTPPIPETPTTITPPTTSTQAAPSMPTINTASATPETLPNTGPGAALIIGLLAILGGYLFHTTHRHIKHRKHHKAAA